jgi:hypothetical protein
MFEGFILTVLLITWGMLNFASGIKHGLIPAIVCFGLAALGVVRASILYFQGEFADDPGTLIFGGLIFFALIVIGLSFFKKKVISYKEGLRI